MLDKRVLNMLSSINKDYYYYYYYYYEDSWRSLHLRIEITIWRLYRVMKNISLV